MTTRRKAASKFLAVPLTKAEQVGLIAVETTPRNERGKPITCKGCGKPGGTLVKIKAKEYRHVGCMKK